VTGYLNGNQVGSDDLTFPAETSFPGSFIYIAPDWTVDKLVFQPSGGEQYFMMTSFTYNPVPEAGAVTLLLFMGGCVLGFAALPRRRAVLRRTGSGSV
jgi:hypothetical protein